MNLKTWQILVFSLVPLALVFVGVIGGSFHGVDSSRETIRPVEQPANGGAAGGPTAPPGSTVLEVTARNTTFNTRSLSAPANTQITVRLTNQDTGVPHNIAFYRQRGQTQLLAPAARGDLLSSGSEQITFTTAGPGSYYFQCDVHPEQMNGAFRVQ